MNHKTTPEAKVLTFPSYFRDFYADPAKLKAVAGARRSGKTFGTTNAIPAMASWMPIHNGKRHIHATISRATETKLKTTAIKEFKAHFPDKRFWPKPIPNQSPLEGVLNYRHTDGSLVVIELLFLSLEREDDIQKLKGLQTTIGHIAEAQDIKDPEILDDFFLSKGRFPIEADSPEFPHPCIMLDFNYPDDDHWLYDKFVNPATKGLGVSLHRAPPALIFQAQEDPKYQRYQFKGQWGLWQNNPEADYVSYTGGYQFYHDFIDTNPGDDAIIKTVIGDFCPNNSGTPVFPEFDRQLHVSNSDLSPVPNRNIIVSFDLGSNPACVIGQVMDNGGVMVLDALYDGRAFFEPFFKEKFWPLYNEKYGQWRNHTTWIRDKRMMADGNTGVTANEIAEGHGVFLEPLPTDSLQVRLDTVNYYLKYTKGMLIDHRCDDLIKSLGGRYRYEKKRGGSFQLRNEPEKDDASHIADAFQNLCLQIYGSPIENQKKAKQKATFNYV